MHVLSPVFVPNLNSSLFTIFVVAMAVFPALATVTGNNGICDLIQQLQSGFKTLRTLAFVDAEFILAKYGWKAIATGKIGGKGSIADGLKEIGIPMIVGFALLFSIGILLGVFTSDNNFGCDALTNGW